MSSRSCFNKECRNNTRKFINESLRHRVEMINNEIFCYREANYQIKKRYRKMNYFID